MRVLSTLKFTFLRMIRNYILLLVLLALPIIMITIFSIILSGAFTETGIPYINQTTTLFIINFQNVGGAIVMGYIHNDFFTPSKNRIYILPFNKAMYAFSILICGSAFSILLGIILMIYSQFVLGIILLNWWWTIFIASLVGILSNIVYSIFVLCAKNIKIADRLGEIYGVGFVILAGLLFPMPQNTFFDFMGSYGNPISLARLSIDEMNQSNTALAWSYANILLSAIFVLFIFTLILGRRKIK